MRGVGAAPGASAERGVHTAPVRRDCMPRGVGPGSSRAGGGVRGALPRRGSLFCTSRAQGRRTALSRVRPAPGAGERDPGRPGCAAGCRLRYLRRCRIPPPRPELPSSRGERGAHISPAPWPGAPSPTRESGTRGWREAGEGVAGRLDVRRVSLPPFPAGLRPPAPLTACLLQRRGETSPRICGWVRVTAAKPPSALHFRTFFFFFLSFFFLIVVPVIQPE